MTVCIIPARGGSKRIPGKNVRVFAGRPLIAHSIMTARDSGLFDRVIVSTDKEEVADVARDWGAEVPFLRPGYLADDFVGTNPVVRHTLEWLQEQAACPPLACCLYATAPLLDPEALIQGRQRLDRGDVEFAVSVTSYEFPIQRALRPNEDGLLVPVHPELYRTRSQDLEERYHDAGQFYWGYTGSWLAEREFFEAPTAAVPLPRHRVQDIDTPEDWQRAEYLYRILLAEEEDGQ